MGPCAVQMLAGLTPEDRIREWSLLVVLAVAPFLVGAAALRASVKWEDGQVVAWPRALWISAAANVLQAIIFGICGGLIGDNVLPLSSIWVAGVIAFFVTAGLLGVLLKLEFVDGVFIQLAMWFFYALAVGALFLTLWIIPGT